jgi:hypothetical protein
VPTWERHLRKHAPVAIVASPIVHCVFDVVGLGAHLTFFSDIAEALDYLGVGPRQDAPVREQQDVPLSILIGADREFCCGCHAATSSPQTLASVEKSASKRASA